MMNNKIAQMMMNMMKYDTTDMTDDVSFEDALLAEFADDDFEFPTRGKNRAERRHATRVAKKHLEKMYKHPFSSVKMTRNGAYIKSKNDGYKQYERGEKMFYSRKDRKVGKNIYFDIATETEIDMTPFYAKETEIEVPHWIEQEAEVYYDSVEAWKETAEFYAEKANDLRNEVIAMRQFIEANGMMDAYNRWIGLAN